MNSGASHTNRYTDEAEDPRKTTSMTLYSALRVFALILHTAMLQYTLLLRKLYSG